MNKKISKIKRVLALCLIFLFSINTFAAIVSDNDGSAFVTKAEFDALKESFNKQVDDYNKSIDGKIDGAIAAYISGIKLSNTEPIQLPFASWEYVVGMNYKPKEEYQYPTMDITVQWLDNCQFDGTRCRQSCFAYAHLVNNGIDQKRLMCDAGTEGATMPTYITWGGRATDFKDNIFINIISLNNKTSATSKCDTDYLAGTGSGKFYYCNILEFTPSYYADTNTNIQNIYKPRFYYYHSATGAAGYRAVGNYRVRNGVFSTTLTNTDYSHILHYKNISGMNFTDKDWIHSLRKTPATNLKLKDMGGTLTKTGKWSGTETNGALDGTFIGFTDFANYYLGDYATADSTYTDVAPTIGLLDTTYSSDKVYQTSDKFEQTVDKKIYTHAPLTLEKGFICFAANAGDTITWQPVFKDRKSNDVANSFELNVELATAPFEEGNVVSTGGIILKGKGQLNDYITTSGGIGHFSNIEIQDDTIIYCKWWPSDTSIQSTDWEATLDLTQCGTYFRTKTD